MRLDATGQCEGVALVHVGHDDDEFEMSVGELGKGFACGADLRETWRVGEAQLVVLHAQLHVHAPVVLQHKGIVLRGNQQHVEDTLLHQVGEGRVAQDKFFQVRQA